MSNNYILADDGCFYDEDELYHYGVLGMKWGVRRGNASKAYQKASKKLNKLNKRAERSIEYAHRKQGGADRLATSVFVSKKRVAKADDAARKAMRKAVVKTRKAQRWLRAMDKAFAGTTESLSKEQIEMGKRYTDLMNQRVFR